MSSKKINATKPMDLKVKTFDIVAGGKIVIMNEKEAYDNDIQPNSRVWVKYKDEALIAMVDLSQDLVKPGEIGLFEEVTHDLEVKNGNKINISIANKPKSIKYIKKKMDGINLEKDEIRLIIDELMDNAISPTEMASFISALYIRGLTYDEVVYLTDAIAYSGSTLKINKSPIVDKHCVGGVNGRATMGIVPIIAAAGLYMPKTSSRSITSAAGTADCMELLSPVDLNIDEMREVVLKTKGAIVWGGGTDIASADDIMIKIRRPLSLDPRGALLASILAKKKSVGAQYVMIDIPVGRGAKFDSVEEAKDLAKDFINIGKRLGMTIETAITDGSGPVGIGVGPSLETRDIMEVLSGIGPLDLREKTTYLAGRLLELSGKVEPGKGQRVADNLIENGKAMKKFRQIIEAQGGDPKIKVEDLPIGDKNYVITAEKSGRIGHIDNKVLFSLARAAGAPADKGAGVILHCEPGDKVHKGDNLYEIIAESEHKLDFAIQLAEQFNPVELEQIVLRTVK